MFVQSCVVHLADSNRYIVCTCWGIIREIDGIYWKHPLDGCTYNLITISADSDELCQLSNLLMLRKIRTGEEKTAFRISLI